MEKATAYMNLWARCNVSPCVFCILGETSKKKEPIVTSIKKTVDEIELKLARLDWDKHDKVFFTGGEAFNHEEPMRNIEPFWELLGILKEYVTGGKLKKIIFSSSFKFDFCGSILEMVVGEIQTKYQDMIPFIEFNTSWDIKYRFFGRDRAYWLSCVRWLRSQGFRLHVSTLCSQAFIKGYVGNSPTVDAIMREFPGDQFDLIPVRGKSYRLDSMAAFFPKRDHFIDFLEVISERDTPSFLRFVGQLQGTAPILYSRNCKQAVLRLKHCGHPLGLKSYANSENCVVCDVEEFLKTFKDGNK